MTYGAAATTTPTVQNESDLRVTILNSFMQCPHRDTDALRKLHEEIQKLDPDFYSHLACWYLKNGNLRDHIEVFSAMLAVGSYLETREVGLAIFREQPVFMKKRILGFIKGKKVKIREKTGKTIKVGNKYIPEIKITEKEVGLKKNVPTSLQTEVRNYLRWLESHPEKFDEVAMKNAKDLKALYASWGLQIKPSPRAQMILFEKKYPEDSKLNVFKKISEAKTPEDAAKMIVENKIPYTVAVGLVQKITPSILVALINAMSPQEIINNVASLQEKGAYDNPEVKKLIEAKLEKAKKAKNVSALKSQTAKKTGRVKDDAIAKKLDDIANTQIKKTGIIKVPTALLIDQSGSMDQAIEIGKRCAALISGVSTANLFVTCFNTAARAIETEDKTFTGWEKAFRSINAHGGTSIGSGLDYLLRKECYVEQIVIITDEHENTAPFFVDVYAKYKAKMKVEPHVVIISLNPNTHISGDYILNKSLTQMHITFDMYKPTNSDYYGLPGLVTLLSRKTKLDLVYEIMETPLLKRKDFR